MFWLTKYSSNNGFLPVQITAKCNHSTLIYGRNGRNGRNPGYKTLKIPFKAAYLFRSTNFILLKKDFVTVPKCHG